MVGFRTYYIPHSKTTSGPCVTRRRHRRRPLVLFELLYQPALHIIRGRWRRPTRAAFAFQRAEDMTTTISRKEAMVKTYFLHEAYKASSGGVDRRAAPSSSNQHVTRSGKNFRTTAIDVAPSPASTMTHEPHEFIIPGVMGYLDIRGILRLGATCKSNRDAATEEIARRRGLIAESIDEINDVVQAMIRNSQLYRAIEYEEIDTTGGTEGVTRRLTRACRMRRFAIDIVRVLLGLSYDLLKYGSYGSRVKTSDIDYVYDFINRRNHPIEYYLKIRWNQYDVQRHPVEYFLDGPYSGMLGGSDGEENTTDDEEDEEYADESEDEGEEAMQLSDEGSNVPSEERSYFDSESEDELYDEDSDEDSDEIIHGGNGNFSDIKMSKRDLIRFRRMLYLNSHMGLNMHDDACVALNGAMYSILVKRFMFQSL